MNINGITCPNCDNLLVYMSGIFGVTERERVGFNEYDFENAHIKCHNCNAILIMEAKEGKIIIRKKDC